MGINTKDQTEWERQIKDAEINRMNDRSAMDIMGARQLDENEAAASDQTHNNVRPGSVASWIQLGIEIEAKQ